MGKQGQILSYISEMKFKSSGKPLTGEGEDGRGAERSGSAQPLMWVAPNTQLHLFSPWDSTAQCSLFSVSQCTPSGCPQ